MLLCAWNCEFSSLIVLLQFHEVNGQYFEFFMLTFLFWVWRKGFLSLRLCNGWLYRNIAENCQLKWWIQLDEGRFFILLSVSGYYYIIIFGYPSPKGSFIYLFYGLEWLLGFHISCLLSRGKIPLTCRVCSLVSPFPHG